MLMPLLPLRFRDMRIRHATGLAGAVAAACYVRLREYAADASLYARAVNDVYASAVRVLLRVARWRCCGADAPALCRAERAPRAPPTYAMADATLAADAAHVMPCHDDAAAALR